MRLKYIALFLALFLAQNSKADNPPVFGSITGSVIDAGTKEPLPYVNVVIRDHKDSILTGGITDDQGRFLIKSIPGGSNKVEIQYIGYEEITRDVDLNKANARLNMSTIALEESSQQLEEVVVRAEASSVVQKIDRKVINVGKDLTATGTSASEMLNNLQSLSVDSQTGAISLRGNENVKILVDGRPTNVSAAQLLKQIPSSSIKSVELITNPSAKYNPEGMSGIINIVLYKNATLGLNGNINGGLTYGNNLRYNGALDLNYRKGKVNIFGNYGGNGGPRQGGGETWRTDTDLHQVFTNSGNSESHLLKLGMDIFLNNHNTLSFYTAQNLHSSYTYNRTDIYFEEILNSRNPREMENDNYTGTYNLNFLHDFKKEGHNIEFEASWSGTDKNQDGLFREDMDPANPLSNYSNFSGDKTSSTKMNLDYTNPVGEKAKLELGLETRFRNTSNGYTSDRYRYTYDAGNNLLPDGLGGFLTEPVPNSSFDYNRNIYSAYASFGQQFGKLSFQAGLRAEYYEIEADFEQEGQREPYNEERFTLYPSAFLTYTPGEKNQLQLSYSRRVDRPGLSQVNPIRGARSSPLLVFVGNPELIPQFTNSYEFNYTRRLKKGSLTAGVFYRRVNNNLIRYATTDPVDINLIMLSWANADGADRYGFELSAMVRPSEWWSVNASFDLYSQLMSGYAFNEYVEVHNVATNLRMNNTFKLTENLSFQLFGMYRGRSKSVQWERKSFVTVNTGLSLKVLNKKGTVNLRVNDIFNTQRFAFESINFYASEGYFFWESRTLYLGYSHHFGQGDFKARKRRKRANDEMSGSGSF